MEGFKVKLLRIRFKEEDQVKGNYILMTSGPVRHVPYDKYHTYLVTIDQIKVLQDAGIDPIIIPPSDTSGLINIKNPHNSGETAK